MSGESLSSDSPAKALGDAWLSAMESLAPSAAPGRDAGTVNLFHWVATSAIALLERNGWALVRPIVGQANKTAVDLAVYGHVLAERNALRAELDALRAPAATIERADQAALDREGGQ